MTPERSSLLAVYAAGAIVVAIAASCSGAQTVEAATCSPKADVWHQVELARVCGEKETDECPAATELRAQYLELEVRECSQKP